MEHLIDDKSVTKGQLLRVSNMDKSNNPSKYSRYSDSYMSLQVEDECGSQSTERCILLTIIEHTDMECVVLNATMTKDMVYGRLYPTTIAKRNCYLVKVKHYDLDKDMVLRISQSQLDKADARAIKLPLTCTTKSWLTDLMD